ncbi:C4-dicarboxylate ABC transporter [Litchfieldella anticariensis FP35 = DSM 16096]|uniref:C4-dicarboxylate ABC transporter n=1 Tax=Litchfieldella anticariensis (strain DSM 16096 / CECT 5854 / CIP 108499 / LMG 22089 / FP35) TaxID=1121939 RepID=S2KHS3_LITA3|nr:AbgT family transporter [Halomonas anticariensis]EPC01515.1 C4-dicarboxylate ABC transporter [Halomonas anticariensis FP35 = DSM 16096]
MRTNDQALSQRKKWYQTVPDPMVLIFMILLATYVLTFVVPAGEYERVEQDGRTRVVPGSFEYLSDVGTISPFDIFVAVPRGLNEASLYLFIVFIAGGLFHILQRTGALENAIGVAVNRVGVERRNIIITAGTFIYGFFGVAVGFENNIALVPIAVLIASAIGCSSLVGTAMAVGGIGIGFALSPINPYTVGVAQGIAELPTFSGAWLRTLLVVSSLALLSFYICKWVVKMDFEEPDDTKVMSKSLDEYRLSKRNKMTLGVFVLGLAAMLVGVFTQGWYINEIAGMFLLIAIVIGIVNRLSANEIVRQMMEGASKVTPGALVIGLAASIQVILNQAQIIDTIVYSLSGLIQGIPGAMSAIMASVVQGAINLFVPSGSGQALVTMPILIPVADLVGMSRQLMITAFQVGDGLTNLIVPTSGGTLAMLALGRVSYVKWLKAILPFMALVYVLAWVGLVIGHMAGY